MPAPAFIGDELTAAAYRLAGAATAVPREADAARALADALGNAPLVFVTAGMAARLPAGQLAAAMRAASPPVLVVPGADGRPGEDLGESVARVLGIEP